MGKVIFLICILAALVHQNVSKPSSHARVRRSTLRECAESLTLPAALNNPETPSGAKYVICGMERFLLINPNKTVNWGNVNQYISKTFADGGRNSNDVVAVASFKLCGNSASLHTKETDNTLDVYGAWYKCMLDEIKKGTYFPIILSDSELSPV